MAKNSTFALPALLLVAASATVLSQTPNQSPAAPATTAPAPTASQQAPTPGASTPTHMATAGPATGQSPSKSLGLLVYPAKQQTPAQQSSDESECYKWSKTQSGYDPMAAAQQSAAAPQSTAAGGTKTARPGVKGAAGGAAIGAIAGNAGAGAAAGAAAGVMKGAAAKRKAQAQQQSAQSQANVAQQQNLDTFKKGMTACLEGRGYSVK